MSTSPEQLEAWLNAASEDEHLEFKEARQTFPFGKLAKHCAALANEGGGKILLGIGDQRPREAVGTKAFLSRAKVAGDLFSALGVRVGVEELFVDSRRVLVFHVPTHPPGRPIRHEGVYWMRCGEDTHPMTEEMLQSIFDEAGLDFSAEACAGADLSALSGEAIDLLREAWARKSQNDRVAGLAPEQVLSDLDLVTPQGITYAALVLLGTPEALRDFLGQAEVVFEYRSNEASTRYQYRREFREGFLLYQDRLWAEVNARNELHHYQEGLFVRDIPSFTESVVREGILNAVCHRDYRIEGSVFVRQSPISLHIVSPGGLPSGVTAENILWRQAPRNRRLAEALAKIGLVERSGQGVDLMFEDCIREGKPIPSYAGTDAHEVHLTLAGEVQDIRFLRFLEKVALEAQTTLSTDDLLAMHLIDKERPLPDEVQHCLPRLLNLGALEKRGRGKLILSRRFYEFVGHKGTYTRKRGLDRVEQKALLAKHIRDNAAEGSRAHELCEVLPSLKPTQVTVLLQELKREKQIHSVGRTRGARWYPGPQSAADGEYPTIRPDTQ